MLMKKLMLTLFFSSGIIIPFTESALTNSQARQLIDVDLYEFKNYRNEMNEKVQAYEKYKIEEQKRIEAEQERLKQEELERQRLAEIEANRVITYNPYNLLEPSNITREEMYKALEGTALQTLSNAYVYMVELYGVNALFLVSVSAEESGWGRSSLAISHNNLGGIKGSNGSYRDFDSWGECIDYKARLLKNQYLSEDGDYFNGYSIWDVNIKYCEQSTWTDNVSNIAYELLNKLNE